MGAALPAMPALFTRMSIRPRRAITSETAALADAEREISSWSANASPPMERATVVAPSRFKSATATAAPAFASRRAMASPMPAPAPVTMAVWPLSSKAIGLPLVFFHDVDSDLDGDLAVEAHGDFVLAQLADGLIQLYLAAVHGEVLLLERLGDVLSSHRSKELIVFPRLLRDRHRNAGENLAQVLGFIFQLGFLAQVRLALLFDDLLISLGSRHGKALGQ